MKKILVVSLCVVLAFAAYLWMGTVDNAPVSAPEAMAKAKTYKGTIYVAGMGGHFAEAKVEINPSDKENPIKILDIDRVVIGEKSTHPTHDARIDVNDRSKMFWSTYKVDKKLKEVGRQVAHVGVSDLKTGNVLKDVEVPLDDRVGFNGALYCASGQTKKSFIPVTMTKEAYIDVFDKSSLKLKHRVFLNELGYNDNYIFFHGTNTPDMKGFVVSINLAKKWTNKNKPEFGARLGKIDNILLDLPALEKGKVKVLAKGQVTGSPSATFTFRGSFTPDGKYLLQSGADRFYQINAKNMKLVKELIMKDGENHDAVPTPDSNYAVLTLRTKGKLKDGTLQLYDIKNRKMIGKPVSVCNSCHKGKYEMEDFSSVLCGADVNWN